MNWEKIFTNNAINLQNKQTTHISPHQEMGRRPRKYFSKGVCVGNRVGWQQNVVTGVRS